MSIIIALDVLTLRSVVQDLWCGRTVQVYDDDGDVGCEFCVLGETHAEY